MMMKKTGRDSILGVASSSWRCGYFEKLLADTRATWDTFILFVFNGSIIVFYLWHLLFFSL